MAKIKRKMAGVAFLLAGLVIVLFSFFHLKLPLWAEDLATNNANIEAFAALNRKVDLLIQAFHKEGRFSEQEINTLLKLNTCVNGFISTGGQTHQDCNMPQQGIHLMPQQGIHLMPQQGIHLMPQQGIHLIPQQGEMDAPQEEGEIAPQGVDTKIER